MYCVGSVSIVILNTEVVFYSKFSRLSLEMELIVYCMMFEKHGVLNKLLFNWRKTIMQSGKQLTAIKVCLLIIDSSLNNIRMIFLCVRNYPLDTNMLSVSFIHSSLDEYKSGSPLFVTK